MNWICEMYRWFAERSVLVSSKGCAGIVLCLLLVAVDPYDTFGMGGAWQVAKSDQNSQDNNCNGGQEDGKSRPPGKKDPSNNDGCDKCETCNDDEPGKNSDDNDACAKKPVTYLRGEVLESIPSLALPGLEDTPIQLSALYNSGLLSSEVGEEVASPFGDRVHNTLQGWADAKPGDIVEWQRSALENLTFTRDQQTNEIISEDGQYTAVWHKVPAVSGGDENDPIYFTVNGDTAGTSLVLCADANLGVPVNSLTRCAVVVLDGDFKDTATAIVGNTLNSITLNRAFGGTISDGTQCVIVDGISFEPRTTERSWSVVTPGPYWCFESLEEARNASSGGSSLSIALGQTEPVVQPACEAPDLLVKHSGAAALSCNSTGNSYAGDMAMPQAGRREPMWIPEEELGTIVHISEGEDYKITTVTDKCTGDTVTSYYRVYCAGVSGGWISGGTGRVLQQTSDDGDVVNMDTVFEPYKDDAPERITTVDTNKLWQLEINYTDEGANAGRAVCLMGRNPDASGLDRAVVYIYPVTSTSYPDGDCGLPGDIVMAHESDSVVSDGVVSATAASPDDPKDTIINTGAFPSDSSLVGCKIVMVDGANAGLIREISSHDADSVSVSQDFRTDIAEGDSYIIVSGIVRSTHYRYYRSRAEDEGVDHQVKFVMEPDMVARLVADHGLASAGDILRYSDDETLSTGNGDQDTVQEYASRSFTYYRSDLDTSLGGVSTTWGGSDDLEGMYGGSNCDENETGMVKSETISSNCGSCGGSGAAGGLTNTYYYLDLNDGPTDDSSEDSTDPVRITIEDTTDKDGNAMYRRIYAVNNYGKILRKVTAVNPQSPKWWCQSYILGDTPATRGATLEHRLISAHTVVQYDADATTSFGEWAALRTFLACIDNSTTLNSSKGLISKGYYNSNGYIIDRTVKDLEAGKEFMVSSATYGDPAQGEPDHSPIAVYQYDSDVEYDSTGSRSHLTSGNKTTLAYTYAAGDTNQTELVSAESTQPDVSVAKNGPSTTGQTVTKRLFDDEGRLQWEMSPSGRINYYAYHKTMGHLVYQVIDVQTNSMPTGITSGSTDEWDAWSGTLPADFKYEGTDAGQLEFFWEYDWFGKLKMHKRPGRNPLYVVELPRDDGTYPNELWFTETRVYPDWDGDKTLTPIQVVRNSPSGMRIEEFAVSTTIDSDGDGTPDVDFGSATVPDGSETLPRSAYVSWTKYNYNGYGQLTSTDRYHNIPDTSTTAVEGQHFYRTSYEYDGMGRRWKVTHPTGRVTITQHDQLGRKKATWTGSNADNATPTDPTGSSDPDNDMVLASRVYYDTPTDFDPAADDTLPVGDSLKTYVERKVAANESFVTVKKYDSQNRLSQIRGHGGIVSKRTIDAAGRITCKQVYVDANSNWLIDSGELRAQSETEFNERGLPYLKKVYEITSSGTGAALASNYWYNCENRLIKAETPDGRFVKLTYDHLGREKTRYSSFDSSDSDYDDAADVTDDTIISAVVRSYDVSGRVASIAVGTTEPSAVVVAKADYEDSNGDVMPYATGIETRKSSDNVGATDFVRVDYEYDAAGRRVAEILPAPDASGSLSKTRIQRELDVMGRILSNAVYDGPAETDTLLSKSEYAYSAFGMTSSKQYEVSSGVAGDYLETTYVYNDLGQMVKAVEPGGAFTQTNYNAYGRRLATYLCTSEGGSEGVSDDIVVEQVVPFYDDAGAVWLVQTFQRDDDDTTTTGALTTSNARVNYSVTWFDDLHRAIAVADYGTNGGVAIDSKTDDFDPGAGSMTYAQGPPAPGFSADCMVGTYSYDGWGRIQDVTDNMGRVTRLAYDSVGRREFVIENYLAGSTYWTTSGSDELYDQPKSRSADECRVTQLVYNDAGMIEKQIAIDPNADGVTTDNQATRYVYAMDLDDPSGHGVVNIGSRLVAMIYPDSDDTVDANGDLDDGSDSSYDRVEMSYWANGSLRDRKDQRGVTHTYQYDLRGRMIEDQVTDYPTNDDHFNYDVLMIARAYDEFGRAKTITSYDGTDASTATVVNQVAYAYSDWGLVATSWQNHGGEAVTSGGSQSPHIDYAYADGASSPGPASYLRLTSVAYPPGPAVRKSVYYNYPTGGIGGALNRVSGISSDSGGTNVYASYEYFGSGSIAKVGHPMVTGGLDLDYGAGGLYTGLDNFGRIVDQHWSTTAGTSVDRYRYGYNGNSSRTWRENVVAGTDGASFDELYVHDELNRLIERRRGDLNATKDAIASYLHREEWSLDSLGNWKRYFVHNNAGVVMAQMRQHNSANEIDVDDDHGNAPSSSAINVMLNFGSDWVDPTYDAGGNMTSGPKPDDTYGGQTRLWNVYDAWNRLSAVYEDSDADGNFEPASDSLLGSYAYDGLHRRVRKTGPSGTDLDYYYNTAWQVLEIRKDGNSLNPREQYVWDLRYIDAPVCRVRDADTDNDLTDPGDGTVYYTTDANMNVTALVGDNGSVLERYSYDAYGRVTVLDADWSADDNNTSDVGNEVLYCGYRQDPETGYYQVRYRYFSPTLGRWVSRDPIGYVDGMNLYEYSKAAPVDHLDPFGLAITTGTLEDIYEQYGQLLRYFEKAGMYREFGRLLSAGLLGNTRLWGRDTSQAFYLTFWNRIQVPEDYLDGNTLVIPPGPNGPRVAGAVGHELFHAYWDQYIEENCPQVMDWLRDRSSKYGDGTDAGKRGKIKPGQRLEVLEEAIANSLGDYLTDSFTVEMVGEDSTFGKKKQKNLDEYKFLNPGYFGGKDGPDYDNKPLDKDIWDVMKKIMECGCDESTNPADILGS